MKWIDGVLVSSGHGGVYNERMIRGHRVWDPYRSKMAALYHLGKGIDLTSELRVLYLGAANGTTVSHIADYTEVVYAVEFAPGPIRDLLEVAKKRENIVPLMADARNPEDYYPLVEIVDLLYVDIAQPDQVSIALRNGIFLRTGGALIHMLKIRSIDLVRSCEEIADDAMQEIRRAGYEIAEVVWLAPYHIDHAAIIAQKKQK